MFIGFVTGVEAAWRHGSRTEKGLVGGIAVCTSRISYNNRLSDPLNLGRIWWVRGRGDIEAVLEGRRSRIVLRRFVQMGRELAKASLGYSLYNRLRRGLLGNRAGKE